MEAGKYNGNIKRDKITYKDRCHMCGKYTCIACDVYRFDGRQPICKQCYYKINPAIEVKCMNCDAIFETMDKKRLCKKCSNKAKKIF
jgi:hypothetical protein